MGAKSEHVPTPWQLLVLVAEEKMATITTTFATRVTDGGKTVLTVSTNGGSFRDTFHCVPDSSTLKESRVRTCLLRLVHELKDCAVPVDGLPLNPSAHLSGTALLEAIATLASFSSDVRIVCQEVVEEATRCMDWYVHEGCLRMSARGWWDAERIFCVSSSDARSTISRGMDEDAMAMCSDSVCETGSPMTTVVLRNLPETVVPRHVLFHEPHSSIVDVVATESLSLRVRLPQSSAHPVVRVCLYLFGVLERTEERHGGAASSIGETIHVDAHTYDPLPGCGGGETPLLPLDEEGCARVARVLLVQPDFLAWSETARDCLLGPLRHLSEARSTELWREAEGGGAVNRALSVPRSCVHRFLTPSAVFGASTTDARLHDVAARLWHRDDESRAPFCDVRTLDCSMEALAEVHASGGWPGVVRQCPLGAALPTEEGEAIVVSRCCDEVALSRLVLSFYHPTSGDDVEADALRPEYTFAILRAADSPRFRTPCRIPAHATLHAYDVVLEDECVKLVRISDEPAACASECIPLDTLSDELVARASCDPELRAFRTLLSSHFPDLCKRLQCNDDRGSVAACVAEARCRFNADDEWSPADLDSGANMGSLGLSVLLSLTLAMWAGVRSRVYVGHRMCACAGMRIGDEWVLLDCRRTRHNAITLSSSVRLQGVFGKVRKLSRGSVVQVRMRKRWVLAVVRSVCPGGGTMRLRLPGGGSSAELCLRSAPWKFFTDDATAERLIREGAEWEELQQMDDGNGGDYVNGGDDEAERSKGTDAH